MVTGVGLTAPAACAAIRVGISAATETRFMFDGEWLMGCEVPFETPWRGREKLLQMVVPAIRECLEGMENNGTDSVPLFLCVAEKDRPGRLPELEEGLIPEIENRLEHRFHSQSQVVGEGRIGGVKAVELAREAIARGGSPFSIVAGVDSLLVAETLNALHEQRRLLTEENSDGFIPGEAAAAVLLGPAQHGQPCLHCCGLGYGAEKATIESGEPLRADGLVQAVRAALNSSSLTFDAVDFRITDDNGEQYGFKEGALAMTRTVRPVKHCLDIWHAGDCTGEVGAAVVPVALGAILAAMRKGYTPGPGVLCHVGNDDGRRAAMVLRYESA